MAILAIYSTGTLLHGMAVFEDGLYLSFVGGNHQQMNSINRRSDEKDQKGPAHSYSDEGQPQDHDIGLVRCRPERGPAVHP